MLRQQTIREKVSCVGVGLHSGQAIRLELLPAPPDAGVTFVRSDLPAHPELRATVAHVADTTLATSLALPAMPTVSVGTVEHLLAALSGLAVDNVRVLVDGPEVPILDGSAAPFVAMLEAAGIEAQRPPKRFLVVRREVRVGDGQKSARLGPAGHLRISVALDFDHPLISPVPVHFDGCVRAFAREVAPARTFGFMHEVEALRARGLARGGCLDNAIVIDQYRILNPEGLRFPDEFARHKLLDAIGDVSLFGMPLIGRLQLRRSGHALNCALVRAVLADPRNYAVVQPADAELERVARGEASPLELFGATSSVA